MSETNVTRRGFFGHAAGAYALVSGVGVGSITASVLGNLIARHKALEAAWVDAEVALDETDDPSQELLAWREKTSEEEDAALNAILSHRPATLEENAERISYLRNGPWDGSVPSSDQIRLLLRSLAA